MATSVIVLKLCLGVTILKEPMPSLLSELTRHIAVCKRFWLNRADLIMTTLGSLGSVSTFVRYSRGRRFKNELRPLKERSPAQPKSD